MKTKNGPSKQPVTKADSGAKIPLLISFRLNVEQAEALSTAASEEGLSAHQMAHDLVLSSLWQQKRGEAEGLGNCEALERQIFELREELALVAEALLTRAGKVSDDDAARWVDENVKPKAQARFDLT